MIPRFVANGDVRLASLDHGGSGPTMILIPGAGGVQQSLRPLVEHLRPHLRVITVDLRGHGGSTEGPWTYTDAVADLAAVVAAYDLDTPIVAGHSLGGMVAATYATDHPAAAAINIDGHGLGRPDQYVGFSEEEVRELWAKADRLVRRLTSPPMSWVLEVVRRLSRAPRTASAATTKQVNALRADLMAIYESVTCPLLVFNAVAPDTRRVARVLADPAMLAAYRQGLRRDLAALAQRHPEMEVAEVQAMHDLHLTNTREVADRIIAFLMRCGSLPGERQAPA